VFASEVTRKCSPSNTTFMILTGFPSMLRIMSSWYAKAHFFAIIATVIIVNRYFTIFFRWNFGIFFGIIAIKYFLLYLSNILSIWSLGILMKNGRPCWHTNIHGIFSNHSCIRFCICSCDNFCHDLILHLHAFVAKILSIM